MAFTFDKIGYLPVELALVNQKDTPLQIWDDAANN
jgi:hypothetical protein